MSVIRALPIALVAALVLPACGDETAPEEEHVPVDATLFVGGTDVTSGVTIGAGQTMRIEVRFLADDGDVIAGLEDEHFASLTFSPAALATVAAVTGEPFMFDVTAQATAGTGTVSVGFGHDEEADEDTFGPFDVTVQ